MQQQRWPLATRLLEPKIEIPVLDSGCQKLKEGKSWEPWEEGDAEVFRYPGYTRTLEESCSPLLQAPSDLGQEATLKTGKGDSRKPRGGKQVQLNVRV